MFQATNDSPSLDLICLSHLRWNFVFQRPQHLMTRCAREYRVFFVEEPIFQDEITPHMQIEHAGLVRVVVPYLPTGMSTEEAIAAQRELLDQHMDAEQISEYVLWYYTPMALAFTDHLSAIALVYDCMDELSAFKGAPALIKAREAELMQRASLVLTGGQSLFDAKRHQHANIHPCPSSVDVTHFAQARHITTDPQDQKTIPHPRLGFFGVIDERFDRELLDQIASKRPDWHFVMIGPVVKIDPESLPKHANIHYLGGKKYDELPAYLAGWDVALLLFARNESTRFISPTKTPEYLAAGKPVISTSIRDVVRPYGELKLVEIADTPDDFIRAAEMILSQSMDDDWLERVDSYIGNLSWDKTWAQMASLIDKVVQRKRPVKSTKVPLGALGQQTGAAATP